MMGINVILHRNVISYVYQHNMHVKCAKRYLAAKCCRDRGF